MTPEQKQWIDESSYEGLLSLWRFAPIGHPMFQGDTGDYYAKVMEEKRAAVENEAHVAASKSIGWSR